MVYPKASTDPTAAGVPPTPRFPAIEERVLDYWRADGTFLASVEARPAGRQPVTVTADANKVADAFTGALEKLTRALDADLGRLKDRHARDTIRTQEPADEE